MTQENKELLLKDLVARLPYGVICDCLHDYHTKASAVDAEDLTVYYPYYDEWEFIEYCKPYLRPLSSMTEKEKIESLEFAWEDDYGRLASYNENISKYIDWLNAHHFDYRGLIERGLVFEAPEGMYN